jgi:hypothetical protein
VKHVVGAVEQRHRTASAGVDYGLPGFRIGIELRPVSLAEPMPSFWLVPEPFSQLGAGRDILHPGIHLQRLLLQAPWPETLDQNALPIFAHSGLVCALDSEHDEPPYTGYLLAKLGSR